MGVKNCSFDEVERDREHGPYDFTKKGECAGCGGCCSNILPMTKEEVITIKRYIKKHNIKEQKHVQAPLAVQTLDMTCPFLDLSKEYKKCTIYEVRPAVCRYFICSNPYEALNHEEMLREIRNPVNVRSMFF